MATAANTAKTSKGYKAMLMHHDKLEECQNTDDLCEVFTSFVFANGLETECDECENDAAKLLTYIESVGMSHSELDLAIWLQIFVTLWGEACDIEYSLGLAIESGTNGWHPKN